MAGILEGVYNLDPGGRHDSFSPRARSIFLHGGSGGSITCRRERISCRRAPFRYLHAFEIRLLEDEQQYERDHEHDHQKRKQRRASQFLRKQACEACLSKGKEERAGGGGEGRLVIEGAVAAAERMKL